MQNIREGAGCGEGNARSASDMGGIEQQLWRMKCPGIARDTCAEVSKDGHGSKRKLKRVWSKFSNATENSSTEGLTGADLNWQRKVIRDS